LVFGNEWKIDRRNRHSASPRLSAPPRAKGFLHTAKPHVQRISRELLQQRITSRAARLDPVAGDQRPIAGGGLIDSRRQSITLRDTLDERHHPCRLILPVD